jgi:micrococcal nuclease
MKNNQKPWVRRHPVWSVVILILLVNFIVIGLFTPEDEPKESINTEEKSLRNLDQNTNLLVEDNLDEANENKPEEISLKREKLFLVTKIIDGDTIEIEGGERIRLICIDTPERNEEGYEEATEYLEDLILEEDVRLEKDVSDKDRYGRLLRYVYLDNEFVNEKIVKEGYGKSYRYNPDVRYCNVIEKAERKAREDQLGIWKINKSQDFNQEDNESNDGKSEYICTSNYYNCDDFSSQSEAQKVFDLCGGKDHDIHKLDRDKDGIACEALSE